jgi:hypothetical protein
VGGGEVGGLARAKKTPAFWAGVEGRKRQRERYFFFFFATFLAGFFLAMKHSLKIPARMHE